ncbi:phosphoribosylaminoimidazolecarboxamide formyltransferase / IMP cyclohydrolase [Cetobacterium ceti]|uniref:Bifunctional purine biosynthesis protein PurH n=1 Tax=Cetobacterium ceti TaxID=180163 RepID=A0A1T4KE21_9FUSO|nr:bifunctional phosphoribosylaminoimidazolecarboxamide formyltransferase/IMP cyclohydrolase [Cetobacterium ceti]SJZ40674.1 phosphoribosylaminoimidazolecarboxamide formyltransferase / IMP cyclohydrolase [Cetobacterium ceti]
MKRALVSVSNKDGLLEFINGLVKNNFEIISTGGTKKYLEENGIKVKNVEEVTDFPEILSGRVKTLHPKIHGGLLALRDDEKHKDEILKNKIKYIDMVVVNLYPFEETPSIENIDIGGPSMLRSGAKNYKYVTTVIDPKDYKMVLEEIEKNGETTLNTREILAGKVFLETAYYDSLIGNYFLNKNENIKSDKLTIGYRKVQDLRYGENPHQKGGFYKNSKCGYSMGNCEQLNGKELSYNNIQDGNVVLEILKEFENSKKIACVGVKHMNPCGVALGENSLDAWKKVYEGDSISIFGGIVGTNGIVDGDLARELVKIFLEIVIGNDFTQEALEILKTKKNLRVLKINMKNEVKNSIKVTSVLDGILTQELDMKNEDRNKYQIVTEKKLDTWDMEELEFVWKVVKHVKSNGIVISKNFQTIGIGAGQMNRVGAMKLALEQGKDKCNGAYIGSDAFFPMGDSIDMASQYEIRGIIQPGGSIKDQESIDICNEKSIPMVFTGIRHFKH